ncbi:MAG: DUF58 domain-containing protein [Pirellulales bacterium]
MAELSIAEIVRKVRKVKIVANRSVSDLLAGQYRSVFRGQGIEFDEVREYQPGDEIRSIDWNVTARTGSPFIKRYIEEREMTVMILLDISNSGIFGSSNQSKLDVMIEMIAVLMFSALKNGDKVGLILFAGVSNFYFPPRKGKSNVLRLIREMLAAKPLPQRADVDRALQFLNRVQRRKAVVFVVSDFQEQKSFRALALSRMRHDLIAMTVSDVREKELPKVGFVTLQDAETGELVEVDAGHPAVRRWFEQTAAAKQSELTTGLRRIRVDQLEVNTHESYANNLRRFFETRERRHR